MIEESPGPICNPYRTWSAPSIRGEVSSSSLMTVPNRDRQCESPAGPHQDDFSRAGPPRVAWIVLRPPSSDTKHCPAATACACRVDRLPPRSTCSNPPLNGSHPVAADSGIAGSTKRVPCARDPGDGPAGRGRHRHRHGLLPLPEAVAVGNRVWPILLFAVAITIVADSRPSRSVRRARRTLARFGLRPGRLLWLLGRAARRREHRLPLARHHRRAAHAGRRAARPALRPAALPFALTTVWLANTASLLLPVSNLTNLLAPTRARLRFRRFAALLGPALVAIVVPALAIVVSPGAPRGAVRARRRPAGRSTGRCSSQLRDRSGRPSAAPSPASRSGSRPARPPLLLGFCDPLPRGAAVWFSARGSSSCSRPASSSWSRRVTPSGCRHVLRAVAGRATTRSPAAARVDRAARRQRRRQPAAYLALEPVAAPPLGSPRS